MKLRRATLADLTVLTAWDQEPHVIAATGADAALEDDGWDWEEMLTSNPPWRELLIGEVDGRPIGMLQIIDPAEEETHYWGDAEPYLRAIDIWIGAVSDLGRGYGTEMMRLAIARCFAPPEVKAILIDPLASNTRAHTFYERCGFRRVGPRRFGDDDCIVYRLDRADWTG